MTPLRTIAIVLSLLVHGSLGYAMRGHTPSPRLDAFDTGSGNDIFMVEQGIGIDSVIKLGEDIETLHTAEVTPVEAVQSPPIPDEKPIEELRDAITSTAVTAREDNIIKTEEPPPPITEPEKPKEVQVQVQPVQVAIAKDESSGRQQNAATASALNEYYGQLSKLFQASKFKPRQQLSGTVEVLLTIDAEGRLLSREVKASSGERLLDETALAIIDRAASDMPGAKPKDLINQQFSIQQTFHFVTR